MNIKQYYKQILNSEINEKLIGKQHKIDADGDKRITRKDFAIINKKSAMKRVTNEMYGTLGRQAVNTMQNNASAQGRPLSPSEKAAAVRHAQNASKAAAMTRPAAKKNSAMNEATPAEIQAHQISRLDRIGNKFNGGEYGADLSKPRNLRAGERIANLYKKAGVMGGFRPYSGLAGSDPVMMRADVSPAYPEAIKNANAELKRDRGSNRTVGQKIRRFVKRTTGLEEMNQVDEMALTKNAYRKMLQGVNDAQDRGDATSGNKSALHWRDHEKKSIALVKALKSPKLFDIGPKGGLVQIGRLKGSKDPARDITYGANFRHMRGKSRIPTEVTRSARELAKLHGMFYTTHPLGDEDVTNPLGKTVAIGGRRGPLDPFYRIASSAARYDN
jgi:hypothetical protein